MNLTNKDYQVLSDFFRWFVPEGLNGLYKTAMIDEGVTERQIIDAAADVLDSLYLKRQRCNEQAAKRMKDYRATDPKYKRTKEAILKRKRAKERLLKKIQQNND